MHGGELEEILHRAARAAKMRAECFQVPKPSFPILVLGFFATLAVAPAAGALRPNERWFQELEWLLKRANGFGLVVALLPANDGSS